MASAQVSELINSSKLTDDDRLRLVMLFALKYERDGRPQVRLTTSSVLPGNPSRAEWLHHRLAYWRLCTQVPCSLSVIEMRLAESSALPLASADQQPDPAVRGLRHATAADGRRAVAAAACWRRQVSAL